MHQHSDKVRIDKLLVTRGLCRSRGQARELISRGYVQAKSGSDWQVVDKPGTLSTPDQQIRVIENSLQQYVSRAALKLSGAFAKHPPDIAGLRALDIGQSTGGFTQVLLQHGVAGVVGVDVGRGQLAEQLLRDSRVICLERVNARDLANQLRDKLSDTESGIESVDGKQQIHLSPHTLFDIAVMDVSFISQTLIAPQLTKVLKNRAALLSLVKPQFEVGRDGLGKGGLVSNEGSYSQVEDRICQLYNSLNFTVIDYFPSSIAGSDGNKEFFIYARFNGI